MTKRSAIYFIFYFIILKIIETPFFVSFLRSFFLLPENEGTHDAFSYFFFTFYFRFCKLKKKKKTCPWGKVAMLSSSMKTSKFGKALSVELYI